MILEKHDYKLIYTVLVQVIALLAALLKKNGTGKDFLDFKQREALINKVSFKNLDHMFSNFYYHEVIQCLHMF